MSASRVREKRILTGIPFLLGRWLGLREYRGSAAGVRDR